MDRTLRTALATAALLVAAAPAATAQEADACAGFKWPVAAERAAMNAADVPVLASGQAYPALGQGVAVRLGPQAGVAYTVKPARPPKRDPAYGAELGFTTVGGTIAVTVSDDAWVDVVQGGKALRSIAFSGKAGCQGVRKSVRFVVQPGPLALAISDAPAATIRLDVTAVE